MIRLAALFFWLSLSPALAQAPNFGQWFYGDTEFRSRVAWVLGRNLKGGVDTLSIYCSPEGAVLEFAPMVMLPEPMTQDLWVTVDGRVHTLTAQFRPDVAEPAWTAPLNADLAQALMSGTGAIVAAHRNTNTDIGLRGSRAAIGQVLAACGAGAAQGPATLDATVVFAAIEKACKGSYTVGDAAVLQTDFDRDGAPDFTLDWGLVQCTSASYVGASRGAGFCGMQMCAVDVYVSSTYRPGTLPQTILSLGVTPWPQDGSGAALKTTASGGSCGALQACDRHWDWNGTKLAVR